MNSFKQFWTVLNGFKQFQIILNSFKQFKFLIINSFVPYGSCRTHFVQHATDN